MFNEEYILELLSGKLSTKGYSCIVNSISAMVHRYQWKKNIIVSGNTNMDWSDDDIQELVQQFFEWITTNEKLKYISKVPYEYLSYYFSQMFISFVSTKIKEEQQKLGISYHRCEELVREICIESYANIKLSGKNYVSLGDTLKEKRIDDLSDIIKYMPRYVIKETTKHFKPLVKTVVDDILVDTDDFVSMNALIKSVYQLLDQSSLPGYEQPDEALQGNDEEDYSPYVKMILSNVTKEEANLYLDYLFGDENIVSLSDLAKKYNMPKSTVHSKVMNFKQKIFTTYIPKNEEDGISFLKNLANSLDEIVK